MADLCRRALLKGSTALGALSLAETFSVLAAESKPKVRYSAFAAEAKQSLVSYAKAFTVMHERSRRDPSDPLGWTYQYKMHWYPDNGDSLVLPDGGIDWATLQRDQIAELDSFFGEPGDANSKRAQAEQTWGKCPHSTSSTIALDFLPWHRMYLLFFERIVRKLSGDDEFALPYWGYMDGKTSQVLPPGFDQIDSSLYHGRSPACQQGDPMGPSFFKGNFWSDPAFPIFTRAVEGIPHGAVHNFVGAGDRDMSSLFQSPRDPVFWLHHCEIDRIWEGALKAGYPAPIGSWRNNKSRFFDENGSLVELTNGDVLNTEQIKGWLGYTYHEVPKPTTRPSVTALAQNMESRTRRVVAATDGVALRSGTQTTLLTPTSAMASLEADALSATGSRRVKLEISNVTLDRRAIANIALYLNAPAGAAGAQLGRYEAGILTTFAMLPGTNQDHAGHDAAGPPNVQSFDVTNLVTQLQREGRWSGELRLTSAEITGTLGAATLKIGKIELVETNLGGGQQ